MRSREKGILCFGDFDGSNYACIVACSCKTECESQTPKTSEVVVEEIEEVEEIDEVVEEIDEVVEEEIVGAEAIEPEDVVQEPIDNVTGTSPNKRSDPPGSRFDIIDISEKEKE